MEAKEIFQNVAYVTNGTIFTRIIRIRIIDCFKIGPNPYKVILPKEKLHTKFFSRHFTIPPKKWVAVSKAFTVLQMTVGNDNYLQHCKCFKRISQHFLRCCKFTRKKVLVIAE